jgi:hypothetical protein
MQRLNCIKIFCYLNFISLVIIAIQIIINSKNSSSPPLVLRFTIPCLIKSSTQDGLTNSLSANYSHMHDISLDPCNITNPLTEDEEIAFQKISDTLITLRSRMIPYPNEYFQGRGIVLTTGSGQLEFAKINLKMLELTGTRLPIQVILILFYH